MQIADFPVLQKSRETKVKTVKSETWCCSKPTNATSCCTTSKNPEENNGACCAQPEDGSACCNK